MQRKLRRSAPYVLMVLPAVVIFAVFFVTPAILTLNTSLTNRSNFSPVTSYVGLDNYGQAVADPIIQTGIVNSLWFAFAVVLLCNLLAMPVAVVLNTKLRGRTFFRALFFSPAMLSILVVGYLWSYILSSADHGLLNGVLGFFGLPPINFLGDPRVAMWSIILTQVWQWFGYAMVIYLANLQSIPDERYEAAAIDGVNRLQAFWHVTLPSLLPAIQINLITGIISGMKVFDIVYSLTKGGPGYATETVLTLMFSKFAEGRFGYASSFGILFLIVSLAISVALVYLFKKMERRLS